MANLYAWQKLTRVLPGLPFGNGVDGNSTVSSDPNTRDASTGTSGSTTLNTGGSTFANGDILLIHQTQGTGAGQWEINKVVSGGGSTSLTLQYPLSYSFVSGAQALKIPMYSTSTISSYTPTGWNGVKGGVDIICGQISITLSGNLNGAGGNGNTSSQSSGGGFYCVKGGGGGTFTGNQGGSYNGGYSPSTSANAGGGGGAKQPDGAGGGGGGYATPGGGGGQRGSGTGGSGGGTYGIADLTSIFPGSAGGVPCDGNRNGGCGGGILIIIANNLIVTGSGNVNGGNGSDPGSNAGGSGAGSGGSILVIVGSATIGSGLLTASGGIYSGQSPNGGNGGSGRIAIHHSGTVTGTTSPSFTDVSDTSLIQQGQGYMI